MSNNLEHADNILKAYYILVIFDKDKQKFPEAYDLTGQKIGKPRRKMKTENEKTLSIDCILDCIDKHFLYFLKRQNIF